MAIHKLEIETKKGTWSGIRIEESNSYEAFRSSETIEYEVKSMPEVIALRTEAKLDSKIWGARIVTPSIYATILTKDGKTLHIYSHAKFEWTESQHLDERKISTQNGSKVMRKSELDFLVTRIYNEDAPETFTIKHEELIKWPGGEYGIEKPTAEHMKEYGGKIDGKDMIAINHPQTLPFLGCSKREAERYFDVYVRKYGDQISICYDGNEYPEPVMRLLVLGGHHGIALSADASIGCNDRWGVNLIANGKISDKSGKWLTMEQLLNLTNDLVPLKLQDELKVRFGNWYK